MDTMPTDWSICSLSKIVFYKPLSRGEQSSQERKLKSTAASKQIWMNLAHKL